MMTEREIKKGAYGGFLLIIALILATVGINALMVHTNTFDDQVITYQKALGKNVNPANTASIMCSIDVELERGGEIVEHQFKENDIFTRNFVYFLLDAFVQDNTYHMKFTDAGEDDYQAVRSSGADMMWGTGSNAPAITDYILQTEIDNDDIGSLHVTKSGNQMNVTITTTFPITGTYGINEVGLSLYDSGESQTFLICRDVLGTTINAVNGDSLTVRYIFTLNG